MGTAGIAGPARFLMLPTQSGGPGAFSRLDLRRVPSPCYVIDEEKLRSNLIRLEELGRSSGARILLALKAFSTTFFAPLIARRLDGCCSSGLWEARLAREKGFAPKEKKKTLSTFSPSYRSSELEELCALSDHLIFNHPGANGLHHAREGGVSLGLRINPEISLGLDPKYDPCSPGSRLGWPIHRVDEETLDGFEGLHFHTLCEQGFSPLLQTWEKIEARLGSLLERFKWINLGGGHHLTRPDYDLDGLIGLLKKIAQRYDVQVYLEPGEAVALDAGILVGEVLDVMHTDRTHLLLDLSATCHAPDVIEAPYRPALLGDSALGEYPCSLGGASCLTADQFGDYRLMSEPRKGDRVAFLDQAHYTMVKSNTFNGVPLPSIAIWNSSTDEIRVMRNFRYEDFVDRLS